MGPYKMPQPEQWLSEHEPWASLAILAACVLIASLVLWLA